MAMIAVRVRDDHGIQRADAGLEQLPAKVGPAVDEDLCPFAFDQNGGAQARVARLGGGAASPVIADLWEAGRRPAPQDPDSQSAGPWALLKSLKKLAVVASASRSSGSSRNSATNAAVSATKAGSHFWPRCGIGARNGESVSTSIWSAGSHFAISCRP